MKNVYMRMAAVWFTALLALGCTKEGTPANEWVYPEPQPEITDGPSEAQKMCYDLYRKYDAHVYYTLAGDVALKTALGYVTSSKIRSNNRYALPIQAADELSARKFLHLLTGFYALFPDDLVCHQLHKRQILVKVNPGPNRYMDDSGKFYWLNTYTEDIQGVVYYGYLDKDTDTGDKWDTHLRDWKWNICFQFIKGLVAYTSVKDPLLPEEFSSVSKGLYKSENTTGVDVCVKLNRTYIRYEFNRTIGKKCGFVHPLGAMAMSGYPGEDWASFVAWILTYPYPERAPDLAAYPRLKQKYDIVVRYYREKQIDLEAIAAKWQAVALE